MPAAIEKPTRHPKPIHVMITSDLDLGDFYAVLTTESASGARFNVGTVTFTINGFRLVEADDSPVGEPWAPTRAQLEVAFRSAREQLKPLRGH